MIKAGDLKELIDTIDNDETISVILQGKSEEGDLLEISDVGFSHQIHGHVIYATPMIEDEEE
jgi:hypothetical protein